MTTQNRKPRSIETRDKTSRQKQWQPASLLPDPDPIDGIEFRWVRQANMGKHDATNFSRALKEGWEPCRLQDHPEIKGIVSPGDETTGIINVGGLTLCKRSAEMGQQRAAYFNQKTAGQMKAVDENLMRENDERMPLFKERKTEVKFGSGS